MKIFTHTPYNRWDLKKQQQQQQKQETAKGSMYSFSSIYTALIKKHSQFRENFIQNHKKKFN